MLWSHLIKNILGVDALEWLFHSSLVSSSYIVWDKSSKSSSDGYVNVIVSLLLLPSI